MATAILPLIGLTYKTVNGTQITVKGDNTDLWIWAFFILIPQFLGLIGVIPYFWYDLTGDKLQKIRDDLKVRHEELSRKVSGGEARE